MSSLRSPDGARFERPAGSGRAKRPDSIFVCSVPARETHPLSLLLTDGAPHPTLFQNVRAVLTILLFVFDFCNRQLASCEGWDSVVPAVCGALVGGLYMMDTMSIQALRLPGVVYRCFSVGVVRENKSKYRDMGGGEGRG